MMPLKDLAYSSEDKAEMKEKYAEMPMNYEGPKYPWGLQLTLDEHCLEKLGLSSKDFTVGETIQAQVVFMVNSLSMHQHEGGKTETVGLTMIKTDLGGAGSSDAEKAEKIYGKG